MQEVFSEVSVPWVCPSEERSGSSMVVTIKRRVDDAELDLKSLFPENMRAMVNAMSASIQPEKKKKTENLKSLGIKLVKKK